MNELHELSAVISKTGSFLWLYFSEHKNFQKGVTVKRRNFSPRETISFLLDLTPFEKIRAKSVSL